MTASSTPAFPVEGAPASEATLSTVLDDRPRLVAGCSFHRYDNGRDDSEFVLCTPDGRQYRVPSLAKEVLARLDGSTALSQIAADLNARSIPITLEQLRILLERRYCSIGVIERCGFLAPEASHRRQRSKIGFPLLFAWQLITARRVARMAAPLRHAYHPRALSILGLMIVAAHVAVYFPHQLSAQPSADSYTVLLALCLVSIVAHEFGHAAAVSRLGGSPGAIGCGLYLMIPTFWTDVSQLWRFSRSGRMMVDLGGVYFQELAFALFAGIGLLTSRPELFAACRLIDVMALMSLNPIFRFDGYWFLVDYLATPKLYGIALLAPLRRFHALFGRREAAPPVPGRRGLQRAVFWSYSILSSGFLVGALWISYRYLTVTVLSLPSMLALSVQRAREAAGEGQLLKFFNYVLAAFFLIAISSTALVGLYLYALRGASLMRSLMCRLAQRPVRSTPMRGETR